MSQFCYGFAEENALRALTLPRNDWIGTVRLECPDKLQKRCRFIVELSVEPADSREAPLRQWKLTLCDSALHSVAATSTTCTSS
jgi:hypothetical protein